MLPRNAYGRPPARRPRTLSDQRRRRPDSAAQEVPGNPRGPAKAPVTFDGNGWAVIRWNPDRGPVCVGGAGLHRRRHHVAHCVEWLGHRARRWAVHPQSAAQFQRGRRTRPHRSTQTWCDPGCSAGVDVHSGRQSPCADRRVRNTRSWRYIRSVPSARSGRLRISSRGEGAPRRCRHAPTQPGGRSSLPAVAACCRGCSPSRA
jgi:hypothetical protein